MQTSDEFCFHRSTAGYSIVTGEPVCPDVGDSCLFTPGNRRNPAYFKCHIIASEPVTVSDVCGAA